VTAENVLELDRIQLHCFLRDSIQSRSNLLGPIMAFRALSGESYQADGRRTSEGVQIVRGKKQVQGWVRRGISVGVKVDLKGPKMYDFLGTLVDFVLPRLREFPGLVLPARSSLLTSPSAATGVVSFGLEPMAMGLSPQLEFNLDAYPKSFPHTLHHHRRGRGRTKLSCSVVVWVPDTVRSGLIAGKLYFRRIYWHLAHHCPQSDIYIIVTTS
jgi:large subunit ribosomal protein L5